MKKSKKNTVKNIGKKGQITNVKNKPMKVSSLKVNKSGQPLDKIEVKITKMIEKGLSRPEIGEKLNMIQSTLWTRLKVIRYKLNIDENNDNKIVSVSKRKRYI